jgi:heptosyltransferase-2
MTTLTKNKITSEERNSFKKILVIQTAFIGDVILVTPLINAMKREFPTALIDMMLIPQTANLLQNNPNINSLLIFNKKKNKVISFFKILKKIYSSKYDIAFLPHSSLTTSVIVYLARIPVRIGFDRWISKRLLTIRVLHIKNIFKIEKYLNLLSPFSERKYPIQTELFPTIEMEENARVILSSFNLNTRKKIIIAPGSIWFTKRWPKEYYSKLANNLIESGFGIIFIGSKEEESLCENISPKKNSINLAGKLSLLESAALIKQCDLAICNDSGALHIANAMKTDVIAFFGPTVKRIGYFPFRENDKVMEIDLDCRPCGSHGPNKCPLGHHNCMKLIEPDFVLNEVLNKFGGT